jgi:hypothetical protein
MADLHEDAIRAGAASQAEASAGSAMADLREDGSHFAWQSQSRNYRAELTRADTIFVWTPTRR